MMMRPFAFPAVVAYSAQLLNRVIKRKQQKKSGDDVIPYTHPRFVITPTIFF